MNERQRVRAVAGGPDQQLIAVLTPAQALKATLAAGVPIPGPPGLPGDPGAPGAPGADGLPRVVQDEGVSLPVRDALNFVGAVIASDDAANNRTNVTIASVGVPPTRQILTGTGLSGGGDLSADRTLSVVAESTVQKIHLTDTGAAVGDISTLDLLSSSSILWSTVGTAPVISIFPTVQNESTTQRIRNKKGATIIPPRGGINWIAGANIDIALADGNPDVDVTITGTGAPAVPAINAQTGTSYTLVASDNGKIVTLSNAAAIALTVPAGLGAGFSVLIIQLGAGKVTVTGSGATVVQRQAFTKTAGQYAVASILAYAANTFVLSGDVGA